MYIKDIIIDGFKSYAKRTQIGEFDPQFTAITGLNGSGKSNILDAICFVLGISNLSQVRASSLQDLVYKSGQTGVTKATVTITFDNTDKAQSPMGYHWKDSITITRQVVIGGKNKYLIDGVMATPGRIHDLFTSVQLNIQNPHFLIMQGRITKVLNMKPPEILSLLEEAAGTRMWENKKLTAQRTIDKKNQKLAEIEDVLASEINPTLTRLHSERAAYLAYQRCISELEQLTRLQLAKDFLKAESVLENSNSAIADCASEKENIHSAIAETHQRIIGIQGKMVEARENMGYETQNELKELQELLDAEGKIHAKQESLLQNIQYQIDQEKKKIQRLIKSSKDDKQVLASRQGEVDSFEQMFNNLKEAVQTAHNNLKKAQAQYQAVSTGNFSAVQEDGEVSQTLQQQLMSCITAISQAKTDLKQGEIRFKQARLEMKQAEQQCKDGQTEYAQEKSQFEKSEEDTKSLEAKIQQTQFAVDQYQSLKQERANISSTIAQVKGEMNKLRMDNTFLNRLHFNYKRGPVLNDTTVKGVLARKLVVKDPSYYAALECAGGGKLYNIIVDTEETGKKLLKSELENRVTLIPLNKIQSREIPKDIMRRIITATNNEAALALSFIQYPKELQSAMTYAFGNVVICKDNKQAKDVCHTFEVTTVTLDGNKFEPSGIVTGGSPDSKHIFLKLSKLDKASGEIEKLEEKLKMLENSISQMERNKVEFDKLSRELELQQQKSNHLKTRLLQSYVGQKVQEFEKLKGEVTTEQEKISESKKVLESKLVLKSDLEMKISNIDQYREQELERAQRELHVCKEAVQTTEKALSEKEGSLQHVLAEAEGLRNSIQEYETELEERNASLEEKICTQTTEHEIEQNISNKVNVLKEQVEVKKNELKLSCKELRMMEDQIQLLEEKKQRLILEEKAAEHKLAKLKKDLKDANTLVEQMLQKYNWIATEKQYFGVPNSAFDFNIMEDGTLRTKISSLTKEKEKLTNNVNMRAMTMLGQAEEKYNDLMHKKDIVENDKTKIANLISELDAKKNEALDKAWHQVNKDFESIFSTLLPGATAKLEPPEGASFLEGLEFRIAFGGMWKESLSELSGGQRSLIALSLILSLLLFKPAPLYILDEIDAALDLSHTQNIGLMLQNHFKHSQFIVVSLKEGMFNNANVLFKTKFVEGISTVTRQLQKP
ncbi:Structural maintenance of chromosomes protein 2-like [Oopsacas minuta]|uniref:Structural maintenance of chromosomes protein n=1 Tax=Oopsacas minuta TaxID=111878 RepID=A0AAV7KFW6_9METZ|nr:Structural maintenance of chromosomes protein 2-like [Oopsacas minuta]